LADELDLESLFAAVGLGPILAGTPSLNKGTLRQAANLPRELRKRVLRFMSSDAFQPAHDMPEFDYDQVLRLVSQGKLDDAQGRALVAAVPDHDLARDLSGFAGKIFVWANPILPRDTQPGLVGPLPSTPGVGSIADFRRVWQVALDPMSVLDDLEDGSLADDQVMALALLYPAIYGELKQAIVDQDAVMRARRKTWEPAPQKAALLQMIRGEQQFDPELAAAVQQMYAQEQAPPQQGPPPKRGGGGRKAQPSDAMTPGQAASTGATGVTNT
jgi:hypothetical protein